MLHWALVVEGFLFLAVIALLFMSLPVAIVASLLDKLIETVRRARRR